MKAKMDDQAKKEMDSYMLVKGAWPLSKVLATKANVWITSPRKAIPKPVLAKFSFLKKRKKR
jgi:hypothetical protein